MFPSKSLFDSPSPSLLGSPQPQPANAYEAAEAHTFFISPKDRVVYVPPRTMQTQPSTKSHTMSGPPPLPGAVASAVPTFDPRTAPTPGPKAHLRQAPASSFAPSFGFGASVPSSAGQTETPKQLRNRLLGGPSTLTLMRREREAEAKRRDEARASTGAASGGAATSTGLFGGGAVPHSGDPSGSGFFPSLRSPLHASASRPSEGTSAGGGLFGGGKCHTSMQHVEDLSEEYVQRRRACGGSSLFGQTTGNASSQTFSNLGGSVNKAPEQSSLFRIPIVQDSSSTPDLRVATDQAIDFGSDILTIIIGVGDRAQTFSIHTSFLAARSPYFKEALLQHPEQKTFNFPLIDPRAFALYFQLIYKGQIPSKSAGVDEYTLLCKLYCLARSSTDVAAQNAALDAILARAKENGDIPASEHVWIIYRGTDGLCGGRKMMVDFYTYEATGEWMKAQGEDATSFPPEFLGELTISLVKLRIAPEGKMRECGAKYHER